GALEQIFAISPQTTPRKDWGWLSLINKLNATATPTATPFPSVADLRTLSQSIDALMADAPSMYNTAWNLPDAYPHSQDQELGIPPMWREWVVNFKQYLENAVLTSSGMVKSGSLTDMNPPAPPNIWIRVYGSSGWATEGPCGEKH